MKNKIILERKQLLDSISRVYAIVEKKNVMSILEYVKIDICDARITFTTTDLDMIMSSAFNVEFDGDLSFAVAVQPLYEIIRKLSSSEVIEFDFSDVESGQIEISAGSSKIKIPSLHADEFPTFESSSEFSSFEVASDDLRKMFLKTKHAMSSGELRHYLNGINLKTSDGLLTAAATDVHRLATSSVQKPEGLELAHGITIPRKAVGEIIKLIEQYADAVTIRISETQISLQLNNNSLVSKLISGKYPNYSSIFSIKPNKRCSVDAKELENAVELVSAIADGKVKIVNLELCGSTLTVSSDSSKYGKHSTAQQKIVVESYYIDELENLSQSQEPIQISFMLNAKYLLDVLTVTIGPRIHLSLSSATAPIIIKDTADQRSMYILMPMQLDAPV